MADSSPSDSIIRKEPEPPAQDPIVSRSTSGILLICTLLMIGVLGWSLFDEAFLQRPWKGIQREFVERYAAYLKKKRPEFKSTEAEIKSSAQYQELSEQLKSAQEEADPRRKEIDKEIASIDRQLEAVTDPFQDRRGYITVVNYNIETTTSESSKKRQIERREKLKQDPIKVNLPAADGSDRTEQKSFTFKQLEDLYNGLKDRKAKLLAERTDVLKKVTEITKKRDDYMKENMIGLTDQQIAGLIKKTEEFNYDLRQINVNEANIVDRCETCHLGTREPLQLTPLAMADPDSKKPDDLSRAFTSHPNKELLQIHNPDRFGCSSCHGGNGRATTSITKAHGLNPFWLHPLHQRENMEAGCQQCHIADRVLDGAPTLTLGKDLFQQRGCVGCHRSENFDRESDALTNARQTITQLEEKIVANERDAVADEKMEVPDTDEGTAERRRLLAHAQSLRVTNSQLAAQIDQLNLQTKFLMQDQKKVGPNLKDVQLKLVKEWIPVWLKDPQKFRPGTKMPTYWRFSVDEHGDDDIKAIAAYLWQSGFQGKVPDQQQARGNTAHGKELFETRGCMACHSIGEGDDRVGGDFAANLTRVSEKADFNYITRWIYNPRERWAPYCPKEKRDLTREDYTKNGKEFIFDTELHSKCPNDGAELQIQNMTVMPNFRLSADEARDIASYLFSLSTKPSYADASFMDDANLKERGKFLIKQYGCAGCHEISGFEEEQRIGKELTAEGSTPLERLDFALMTRYAEEGIDPVTEKEIKDKNTGETQHWYNHRGFFDNKLKTPWIYDKGKEKEAQDRLRMPQPYLTDEWRNALTTFLLGSVGIEGANVPKTLFYSPDDRRRAVQDGWWVIKKYNCMGCHNVQVGQSSVLMNLPLYQQEDWKDQLPPRLTSEGARVDPGWLLRFLQDPSLSDQSGKPEPGRSDKIIGSGAANSANTTTTSSAANTSVQQQSQANANSNSNANASTTQSTSTQTTAQQNQNSGDQVYGRLKPQPGEDRNGVRVYLKARMPTFNFSPNELRTLVRFFMAVSSQADPYIKEPLQPLTEQERMIARQMFTSGTPCLKCHITGDKVHDEKAIAPNFLLAAERLKPEWTYRWLLKPSQISPGTAMPDGLFTRDEERKRWVLKLDKPPAEITNYHGDHADLLVRYMFLMTPDEQRRLMAASPSASGGAAPAPKEPTTSSAHAQKDRRRAAKQNTRRAKSSALMNHLRRRVRAPVVRIRRRSHERFSP